MPDINKVIDRLHEIDLKLKELHEERTRAFSNFVTGGINVRKYYVPIDPYQVTSLLEEKKTLIRKLKELSAKKAEAYSAEEEVLPANREDAALHWGVEEYLKAKKPRHSKQVKKDRTIARQAVDKFFSELKGVDRDKKIDAIRDRIAQSVKKRLEDNPTS